MLLLYIDCSFEDLWEEWDSGFCLPTGQRTRPFRDLTALEKQDWRRDHSPAMRKLLERRRAIWTAMEKVFRRAPGNTETERKVEMLKEMEAMRSVAGSDKKLSNNQLWKKLKNFQ